MNNLNSEYVKRDREDFGLYSTSEYFSQISETCNKILSPFTNVINILDIFSGEGLFALRICQDFEKTKQINLTLLDNCLDRLKRGRMNYLRNKQNFQISSNNKKTYLASNQFSLICGDILSFQSKKKFELLTCRFGTKEINIKDKTNFFIKCHDLLQTGGIFVIMDMYSSPEFQEEVNYIHWEKHRLGGRKNIGWISTIDELRHLLKYSRLKIYYKTDTLKSSVSTSDWMKNGQINTTQKNYLEKLLYSTTHDLQSYLKLRKEKNGVRLEFPVVIIIARKK